MPSVSVITRTKDRMQFLERAFSSISAQSESDIEWIIVNDGGNRSPITSFVESLKSTFPVRLIHLDHNKGRAAAANVGLHSALGTYIVLHDDDDTWDPRFLYETTRFLDRNEDYLAVNTHATEVTEKIDGDTVVKIAQKHAPFNTDTITFLKMATFNPVSTIGCLFRKSVFEKLGGFDESLDILEDYDFFLRLLLKGDIGNIQIPLACYHIRHEHHTNESFNNTVTVGRDWHKEMLAKYRNYHLRKDLQSGQLGLGSLLMWGEMNESIYLTTTSMSAHLEKVKRLTGYSFLRDRILNRKD